MALFIFDLDMTLVDSSALESWRRMQFWAHVKTNLGQVKPFVKGSFPAHELPARLQAEGHKVAVVTSSPRWYAVALTKQFNIPYDALVAYEDTEQHKPDPAPLLKALELVGAKADDAGHVGDQPTDVEASFHAKVVSIGAAWGVQNFDSLSSSAPDLLFHKPSSLLKLDLLLGRGYVAEVLSEGHKPAPHWGATLPCGGDPIRYALGRYFTAADPRHATSKLSANILDLKNGDAKAPLFAEAVAAFLREVKWRPDSAMAVPPKPSQSRHRFQVIAQHLDPDIEPDIEIALDGLKCVKEVQGYKQMNSLQRAEAIKGAFATDYTWDKGKVLLLDDVLTTGETTNECARVLLARNASEVRILALARDQQTFARQFCPACSRTMKVRTNGSTGEKFWGCSGYPHYCHYTMSM